MSIRFFLVTFAVSGLAFAALVLAPDLAGAQSDEDSAFEEFLNEVTKDKGDQKICRNATGDASKAEQRAACTRLIDNASNENDLVGEYYFDRSIAQDDAADQCRDVRKGIAIIENFGSANYTNLLAAAHRLEEASCD